MTLDFFFDMQDKFRKPLNPKTHSSTLAHEIVNLRTNENPQNINIGTYCTEKEKHAFIKLFKKYQDVFAWSDDDLKTYDTKII